MEYKDYYRILGLSRGASQDEVKRAYRKLARKFHPDVSKEPNAEERFKEVGEAYEVLKDPEKREAYDRLGANWKAGQDFRPPPGWEGGFDFGGGGFTGADASRFSDFFESLFGGMGAGPRGTRGGRGFSMRGSDERAKIQVSLEDAYHGATRTIQLQTPEVDRHGRVAAKRRALKLKIPAGVTPGQQIRLAGQGGGGHGDGASGDLYLEIEFQPHPLFRAQDKDVYLNLPITPWEAALGAKVSVPTLAGKVDLRIPAGSQSGRRLRLKGRGLGGAHAGDQYVVVQIVTPAADTEAARELYRRMEREMPYNPRAHMEA